MHHTHHLPPNYCSNTQDKPFWEERDQSCTYLGDACTVIVISYYRNLPVTSLVVVSARDEVLEGWRLLGVICGGAGSLHIAKLALEGPGLHQLFYVPAKHLHQSMQSMLGPFKSCNA